MEKDNFIEKISAYVRKHRLFKPQGRYLAAVSGGADSVVMLRAMLLLGVECEAAHCNFGLRGDESRRDEAFVTALCGRLGVKLHKRHFDVAAYESEHGVSTEMACRELRYAWFREVAESLRLDGIIVAHHSDDNIETLLLNILRGTGIAGLAAIRPFNGGIIRPLLCVSRSEIEAWAAQIGQDFVTDSTNGESVVKRNRLRNIILPALRQQFPDADAGILRTIENMRQCNALYQIGIQKLRQQYLKAGSQIALDEFINEYIDAGCAETLVFEFLRPYGFNATQAADLLTAYQGRLPSGKRFLSATHEAVISHGSLCFLPLSTATCEREWPVDPLAGDIAEPVKLGFEILSTAECSPRSVDGKLSACFSTGILAKRLVLRHWRRGDSIRPFGMRGTRLVSDIFSDLKLTEAQKRSAWILTADGQIVWILGIRASALHAVTAADTTLVRLTTDNQPSC